MARPAQADAEATRRRILACAMRTFGERGLDGATLRVIGTEAGVTFATVHHYFGTKDRLFDACLDDAYAQLAETGLEIIQAVLQAPREQRIAEGVRGAFRAARKHPDRTRFLLRALVFEASPATRRRLAGAQRGLLERVGLLLDDGHLPGTRTALVGLGFLITRFAVSSTAELKLFTADQGGGAETLEAYLVKVAEHTLRLKPLEAA